MNFPLDIHFVRTETRSERTRETKINFLTSANFGFKMIFLLFARANELKNRLSKISLAILTFVCFRNHFSFSFTILWDLSLIPRKFFILCFDLESFSSLSAPLLLHLPSFQSSELFTASIFTFSSLRKEECYFRRYLFR